MAKTCVETSRSVKISPNALMGILITAVYENTDVGAVSVADVAFNGFLEKVSLFCPNMDNAVTMTLTIVDEHFCPILTTPASAENDKYVFYLHEPVSTSVNLSFSIGVDPGASGGIFQVYLEVL